MFVIKMNTVDYQLESCSLQLIVTEDTRPKNDNITLLERYEIMQTS